MTNEAGLVFDRVAADYDRVRSSYPDLLVDAACSVGGLGRGARVVEVGCGTGKLTTALVERGLNIDAVDLGAELVGIARRRLGGSLVRFHIASFEDVGLPLGSFDAVFSATAFHWVDPAVSWAKAARLLHPGGVLALLTHVGGVATVPIDKEQTADESLALVRTTSSYLRLDGGRQRRLEQNLRGTIERAGGKVSSRAFATLVTARVRV